MVEINKLTRRVGKLPDLGHYPGSGQVEAAATPLVMRYVARRSMTLIGFWHTWHQLGGRRAMVEVGFVRQSVYRWMRDFEDFFGVDVETATAATFEHFFEVPLTKEGAAQIRREQAAEGGASDD